MEKNLSFLQLSLLLLLLNLVGLFDSAASIGEQPLAQISIHKATLALDDSAKVTAYPVVLGRKVATFHQISIFFFKDLIIGFCVYSLSSSGNRVFVCKFGIAVRFCFFNGF